MATIRDFRDLDAWKVAMELAVAIYALLERLPSHERFEMANQMRRAALSVPSNVAEGHGTKIRKRYRYHVRIAAGSIAELMTCIELGTRLGYWKPGDVLLLNRELDRVNQLLNGILRSIRKQLAVELSAGSALVVLGALLLL